MSGLPFIAKFLGDIIHSPRWIIGIQECKLSWENGILQNRLPEECQIRLPRLSKVVVWTPWCIESVHNQITGESAQELNGADSQNTLSVEILKRIFNLCCGLGVGEIFGQNVGILDGLASSLSQVGHHGVDSVTHEDNISIGPATEEFRGSVVKVALFDRFGWGRIENRHDLIRPALVQRLDVFDQIFTRIGLFIADGTTPSRRCFFGTGWEGKEGIPLHTPISNIRSDEITLGTNVDLVSRLVVVVGFEHRLSRKDCVSGVIASLALLFVFAQ
mmetsp:Transcript_4925/g.11743  ORF Transcript_4925/g.11743 Transcript_4925/m.11743 type:complete len:274 (+) Transcript_4925:210-1031(+)